VIPIQNIYYLLVYAWDVLEEAESISIASEKCSTLAELLGLMLSRGTERVLRRGLDRGYLAREELIAGIRGKVNLAASVKTAVLQSNRAVCAFDDLSHDIPANRIVASTLRLLLARTDVHADVQERIEGTCYRLTQIPDVLITDQAFRTVQLHRNNRQYRLLIDICRLVHHTGLTREDQGEVTFQDFVKDKHRMRRLFERFVRNFIRHEVDWLVLERQEVPWHDLQGDAAVLTKIPRMRTDILARGLSRRLIIDTKFTPVLFNEGLGGKLTVRSSHLYQLHAYISNLAPRSDRPVDGMLLYPAVNGRHDLKFRVGDRAYRVATLDLNQPWQAVRNDLLELLCDVAR
jgi:5-methylcytosine-specific restriction enzyme subunit McrC